MCLFDRISCLQNQFKISVFNPNAIYVEYLKKIDFINKKTKKNVFSE